MTLSYVQTVLQPERSKGEAPWFVQQDAGILVLRQRDELRIDLIEFDQLLDHAARARADARPSNELDLLERALTLWRGDPFDGVGDGEWLDAERRRVTARFISAAQRAGSLLLGDGRWGDAARTAERGLVVDPWNQTLHLVAVRANRSLADPVALQYATLRCKDALRDLGVVPDAVLARELKD